MIWKPLAICLLALPLVACNEHGHDHPHGEDDHPHGEDDHSHGEDDHSHGHDEDDHGHDHAADDHGHDHGEDDHAMDDHGHDHGEDDHGADEHGHDDHGHGHDGASEVVTLWGERTQLFVEFPALVVGEESAFAAHLTRLSDHLAIDAGTVTVELTDASGETEAFAIDGPSVAGIFRPVVVPSRAGQAHVTLRLDASAASEVHEMGAFAVYATRAEADAAAEEDESAHDEISYLLEQQWQIPFRVAMASAQPLRPNFQAFAELALPPDAETVVTAPRDGRVTAAGGRFPVVGEGLDEGSPLFVLATAPTETADPAALDLAVDQAEIRVSSASREVDRLTPLVAQGVVSQRRLDEAQSALDAAEAELRSARRQRRSLSQSQRLEANRDALQVPSPMHGTLAELLVSPGTWVSEGQELARVVNRDRLVLDVGVPEAYVGRVGEISGAWFELDNVAGVFEVPASALLSVATELDPATRTLAVRFELDNVRQELFAGMRTQAHLIADAPRVTTAVPLSAVIDDSGTDVVYVQTGGESFVRRPVLLGIRDGELIEILGGVAPGEWVVTEGAYAVKLASTSTEAIGHGHAH